MKREENRLTRAEEPYHAGVGALLGALVGVPLAWGAFVAMGQVTKDPNVAITAGFVAMGAASAALAYRNAPPGREGSVAVGTAVGFGLGSAAMIGIVVLAAARLEDDPSASVDMMIVPGFTMLPVIFAITGAYIGATGKPKRSTNARTVRALLPV